MATTSLWKFSSRLKGLIDYVSNDEKTNNKEFVSGVNCLPNIAYQEMMNTKKQFFKTDGIECFHGYQSFVSGEVTPEVAHEIGIKLAEKLWGDKYQVIVATHTNTANIHNHFVLNSVSFKDGKKFTNRNKDYNNMQYESDNLCKEYGLSVLPKKYDYSKYATNNLYKELMQDSIDYAIENANNYDEFISIMNELDYEITIKNDELSIKREPYKRNTRILKQFGEDYSLENIKKRILEKQPLFKHLPQAYLTVNTRLNYYNNSKNKLLSNKSNFSFLFLSSEKVFMVGVEKALKTNMTKYTPELIREIKQMHEYSKQADFLTKYTIKTEVDLNAFKKSVYEKLNTLKSERENLWKKHKKARTKEEKLVIENKQHLLFCSKNKTLYAPNTINSALKRLAIKLNIGVYEEENKKGKIIKNTDVHTHMLRGTFATRCAEAKIAPAVLKKILGHKDISITMKYYVDVDKEFEISEGKNIETYLMNKDIFAIEN